MCVLTCVCVEVGVMTESSVNILLRVLFVCGGGVVVGA